MMWRLVYHPDNSYCVARDEEEKMIAIEMKERYPKINTVPFRILSILELVAALYFEAPMLVMNSILSILAIITIECDGEAPCVIAVHYSFMLSLLPFFVLEKAYVSLLITAVHLMMYTIVLMSRKYLTQ